MSLALLVATLLATTPAPEPDKLEESLRPFLTGIEQAVAQENPKVLDDAMDMRALLDKVVEGVPAPTKFRDAFLQGARSKGVNLGTQVVTAVQRDGSFRLLRVRKVGSKPRALFRLLSGETVNYFELYLDMPAEGPPRIKDVYLFLAGETLSASMRRVYIAASAEANRGLLDMLKGTEREFLEHASKVKEMADLQRAGEYEKALEVYARMPPSMRKNKSVMLMRVGASYRLDSDEQYLEAIEDFEAEFPNDPALDMVSIDGHFLRKDYDGAVRSIDRLEKRVGGDPYLRLLRGSVLLEKGDKAKGREELHAAVAAEPTLVNGWWTLISLALEEKNYKETAELLVGVETQAGVELGDLKDVPTYADFVKSREYKAWMKKRPSNK